MLIRDVMSTYLHTIRQSDTTATAARKMKDADVGCLIVTDDGVIEAVVTDRDLAVRCLSEGHDSNTCPVAEHMSSPAVTVDGTSDMLDAARLMRELEIRRVPVVLEGRLVGLVSLSDIAQAMDKAMVEMDRAMHDLLLGLGASRS